MNKKILKQLENAKKASEKFGLLPHAARKMILRNLATGLRKNKKVILKANLKDLQNLPADHPMRDRLLLNIERLEGMAREIEAIAKMPDPIGEVFDCRERHGLKICRTRVPMGVVGIIYESRPNVTTDVAAICIKSGNAAVLKGGKEARESYIILHKIIRTALIAGEADPNAVQLIDPKITDAAETIITANKLVDVVLPRGSQGLINFVRENATVPFIETGAGVCHTFVDESAKLVPAAKIIFNAKTQRPSVCNALDTLLVHKKIAKTFLPMVAELVAKKKVEIFADSESYRILKNIYPKELLQGAKASDFGREFLSQKMSVKVIAGLDAALEHIARYSSKHSEAILSENKKSQDKFLKSVDAGVVYTNASTRFSDGAMFGLGSEIGTATSKLHARGPMGPREITTYKWVVKGKYSIRK